MISIQPLRAWRLSRLQAQHQKYLDAAEYWRTEAQRLAIAAYNIPDMMQEPLEWGRLQNGANWAKHHERQYRAKATKITKGEV